MTDPLFLDLYVKDPTFLTSRYMHRHVKSPKNRRKVMEKQLLMPHEILKKFPQKMKILILGRNFLKSYSCILQKTPARSEVV